jgi:hypothetical protein
MPGCIKPKADYHKGKVLDAVTTIKLAHQKMTLDQTGHRVLQECWGSAQRCERLTSISAANDMGAVGEGRLRPSWRGQASGLVW